MEYNLYSTDDRRYARVIQPDVGESSSGSSYAGSDEISASGHPLAEVVKADKTLPSNRLSEAESSETVNDESRVYATEPETGPNSASRRSHNLLVRPFYGSIIPGSRISHERGEDDTTEIERHHNSSTITDGSTIYDLTEGDHSSRQVQERLGDGVNETLGSLEHSLGAITLSSDNNTHIAPVRGNNLGSGVDLLENDRGKFRRIVAERDAGESSHAGSLRRTSISAGPDISDRRSPPLERSRSNSVHSGRNFNEIVLPRWQPDAEVTYCPICRTQFSFFVRKHHCRYALNHTCPFPQVYISLLALGLTLLKGDVDVLFAMLARPTA